MGNSALLIIEAQVGIIERNENGEIYEKEEFLSSLKKVIDRARRLQVPVIYIMDQEVAKPDSMEYQIHPHIAPYKNDTILTKKSPDIFHQTTLQDYLQMLNISHIVLCGCKTEYSIDASCRSATTLGYDVTLISNAHSTFGSEVLEAKEIIAHHNLSLNEFKNGEHFVLVRSAEEEIFDHLHLNNKSPL